MKLPKIKWSKIGQTVAAGRVGKITAFEISKVNQHVELTCELPNVNDRIQGRLITRHSTVQEASRAADETLKSWLRRLYDDA